MKPGRLQDQVVVISGAAGGIGQAAAERFAAEGAKLVLIDTSPVVFEVAKKLSDRTDRSSNAPLALQANITVDEEVESAVGQAALVFGQIDVLFNTAGGSVPADSPVDVIDLAVWHSTLQLDLNCTFLMCRHVIPHMKTARKGTIVNMSSGAGLRGSSASHAYTSAKGAIVSLTRVLAGSYAKDGIRANAICAGRVNTERIRTTYGVPGQRASTNDPMDGESQYKKYPFWFSQPSDVANVALFLACDESRMITGAAISADGGRSAY